MTIEEINKLHQMITNEDREMSNLGILLAIEAIPFNENTRFVMRRILDSSTVRDLIIGELAHMALLEGRKKGAELIKKQY